MQPSASSLTRENREGHVHRVAASQRVQKIFKVCGRNSDWEESVERLTREKSPVWFATKFFTIVQDFIAVPEIAKKTASFFVTDFPL